MRKAQCVVWVALAAVAVARLDARTRTHGAVPLPDLRTLAASDTRHRPVVAPPVDAEPFAGFAITDAMRDSIVRLARAQVGRRYRFGGTTPVRGFDCSGLVRYVVGQLHIPLPRLAAQQARMGEAVSRDDLRPGDLVSFGERDTVSHIGIYVGQGHFVHASSVAGRVIVSPLNRPPSQQIQPLRGARRLYALTEQRARF